MRRFARSSVVLVALAGAAGVAGCSGSGGGTDYAVEDLATGEAVSVADLAGSPALLVSWATWCRECEEELAGLAAFASSPEADDVRIVAVNLDAGDVDDEIQAKVDGAGLTVELWRDRRNEFRSAFGALGVPTTVVLDAGGEVVGTFPGAVDFDDAEVLDALDDARGG